jgi:hypothetical protein
VFVDPGVLHKASVKGKEASLCFVVYEKKGMCFSPSAQKYKFRPHQSSLYMDEKIKIYYKVWTNLQSSISFLNYNILYKDNSRVSLKFFHNNVFGFITIR